MFVMSASFRRAATCALVALTTLVAVPGFAQAPPAASSSSEQQVDPQQIRQELDRLRQEFDAIRESYGARLAALEAKLTGVAPAAVPTEGPPPAAPAAAAEVPAGAAGAGGPEGTLPVYGNSSALSKIFNPDMAVIGNFLGAAGENTVEPLPALEMREAEVSLQAVVDPYARADFFLAASPEGLEIEEGFLTLTSLPGGLLAKVGQLKEQFGR